MGQPLEGKTTEVAVGRVEAPLALPKNDSQKRTDVLSILNDPSLANLELALVIRVREALQITVDAAIQTVIQTELNRLFDAEEATKLKQKLLATAKVA